MRRVLVVEDDPVICDVVAERLRAEGYEVVTAGDGPAAVAADVEHDPDVVVLDLMLPGYDGLEVCRRVQQRRPVPVLMLTARDDEADVLTGLAVGADDYLTKPFRMRELVARVAVLLRRVERARELADERADSTRDGQRTLTVGPITVDTAAHRVHVDDAALELTPTEFDLLACLARSPGEVLRRDRLLAEVWGWHGGEGSTRTVDSHVKALRAKVRAALGADPIRTVHGVGYALEVR